MACYLPDHMQWMQERGRRQVQHLITHREEQTRTHAVTEHIKIKTHQQVKMLHVQIKEIFKTQEVHQHAVMIAHDFRSESRESENLKFSDSFLVL